VHPPADAIRQALAVWELAGRTAMAVCTSGDSSESDAILVFIPRRRVQVSASVWSLHLCGPCICVVPASVWSEKMLVHMLTQIEDVSTHVGTHSWHAWELQLLQAVRISVSSVTWTPQEGDIGSTRCKIFGNACDTGQR
jgi:hypothetical protein